MRWCGWVGLSGLRGPIGCKGAELKFERMLVLSACPLVCFFVWGVFVSFFCVVNSFESCEKKRCSRMQCIFVRVGASRRFGSSWWMWIWMGMDGDGEVAT